MITDEQKTTSDTTTAMTTMLSDGHFMVTGFVLVFRNCSLHAHCAKTWDNQVTFYTHAQIILEFTKAIDLNQLTS